jgi:hypothetical protein
MNVELVLGTCVELYRTWENDNLLRLFWTCSKQSPRSCFLTPCLLWLHDNGDCFEHAQNNRRMLPYCLDLPVHLTLYKVRLASVASLTRSLNVRPMFCCPDAGAFLMLSHRCCRLLLRFTHGMVVLVTFMARHSCVLTPFWFDRTTMAIVLNMWDLASRPRPVLPTLFVVRDLPFRSA